MASRFLFSVLVLCGGGQAAPAQDTARPAEGPQGTFLGVLFSPVHEALYDHLPQLPRSQGVLKAIEALSEALGMSVIAEGVETADELEYLLTSTRIRYAQGYYFSKPFFLEDAMGTLRMSFDGRTATAMRERPDQRGSHSSREAG